MLTTTIYAGLFLAAMYYSVLKGSPEERSIGIVLLVGNLATVATLALFKADDFRHVSEMYVAVDALCSIALCALATKRPSWMAIFIAAFQINGTLGHLVKILSPETLTLSYAFLLRAWAWPMIIVLLVCHWNPNLRDILRQSHLMAMPFPLGPRPMMDRLSSIPPHEPSSNTTSPDVGTPNGTGEKAVSSTNTQAAH
jgi:hypothetical protein